MSEDFKSKDYTLEKHLRFLCNEDPDYEMLYSIWDLNKNNLSKGLSVVPTVFPNYSVHDATHSMKIVNNIQCFLGEDRIKRLGATDTFLILMAGLTHDIGMILTYKMISKEWQKDNFKRDLENFLKSSDDVISEAAKLLLDFKHPKKEDSKDGFKWALEIKNAVTILTAEIFRSKHANQSAEYLTSNEEFKKLAEDFHFKQLPNRFMDLLAKVAYLHGACFEEVMSSLYQTANGFKGDYIHPRFIACMLRLGDLLDFDSDRFNPYFIATLKEMPETSLMHQQKHASVKHMLISPNSIEAELDCNDEDVYRISRSWFDWLEDEVSRQSREWTRISPIDLGGLPPVMSKNSVRILFNGIQARPEFLNLKFRMSQQKIFNIIQGGSIYKEPNLSFIREIVQNALDASKIQLWKDIESGFYDSFFVEENKKIEQIEYPNDIMPAIYRQYPVELTMSWKDENKSILHFECSDRGTGISEKDLLRMTNYVGESRFKDKGYSDFYEKIPYWLKPTAAFGIGLQSIFYMASSFEVETSYPGETKKRIIFKSSADDQYSYISKKNIEMKRGTTIKVDIKKEKFLDLIGNIDNFNIIINDEYDIAYIGIIDNYIRTTFSKIENLPFKYNSLCKENDIKINYDIKNNKESSTVNNCRISYIKLNDDLAFHIYEKQIGSTLILHFNDSITEPECLYQGHNDNEKNDLFIRDIIISETTLNSDKTSYFKIHWNINSYPSNLVVDLSRDRISHMAEHSLKDSLFNVVIPNIMGNLNQMFINYLSNANIFVGKEEYEEQIRIQYLNFCLTAIIFKNKDVLANIKYQYLDINIDPYLISCNGTSVRASSLIKSKELYIVHYDSYITEDPDFEQYKDDYENKEELDYYDKQEIHDLIYEKYHEILANEIILWNYGFESNYFDDFVSSAYVCSEIIKSSSSLKIYKLKIFDLQEIEYVKIKCLDEYLDSIIHFSNYMTMIYGLDKYKDIVIYCPNNFSDYMKPKFCQSCILIKFPDENEISKYFKGKDETQCKNILKENIYNFITNNLIKYVRLHNLNKDVTDEQIKNGYVDLLYDTFKNERV